MMAKTINVHLGRKSYPIVIQNRLLDKIGFILKHRLKSNPSFRCVIITDKNVASLYLDKVISSLNKHRFKWYYLILPPGENQKSYSNVNKLYEFLIKNKIERNDLIISLGGGVVGDIAGFVAGTYKRGIGLVHIPTSLIAQADSSIGGKTAINYSSVKNLIGMFYQPNLVIIDPHALKTLPENEFNNGMAEIIKVALIKDKHLFKILRIKHKAITNLNPAVLEALLYRAIRIKVNIIERDEKDIKGQRILLNYGHTIGHILESLGKYKYYKHGEAIAIGMMIAAKIAQQMKLIRHNFIKKQAEILEMYCLPSTINKQINLPEAFKFLCQDKKIKDGKIQEVLPNRIGSARVYKISLSLIRTAFIK
jgi:3-dehydroquinate synthase